jgi:hypothetical protein
MRLRLDQFDWLTRSFEYTDDGAIAEIPPMEVLRSSVEEQWRAAGKLEWPPLIVESGGTIRDKAETGPGTAYVVRRPALPGLGRLSALARIRLLFRQLVARVRPFLKGLRIHARRHDER